MLLQKILPEEKDMFASMLEESGTASHFKHICVPDSFVKQASVAHQLKTYKLDKESIINEVKLSNVE